MSMAKWNSLMSFMMVSFPKIAVAFTLLLYVSINGEISADRAFLVVNMFDYLNIGVVFLPMLLVQWGTLKASPQRARHTTEERGGRRQKEVCQTPLRNKRVERHCGRCALGDTEYSSDGPCSPSFHRR